MATTYLNKTLGGTGNKDKWTFSCWVKRHATGVIHPLLHADDGSSNYYTHISFHDTDQLFFQNRWNNGNDGYKITSRQFRDLGAWYHLQFVWDSGNATANDRQIIYVNGGRLTDFGGANVGVTQDRNTTINDGYEHRIGRGGSFNGSAYADVTMAHVHFADGQAYAPTVFGETDSTSGIWKPKVNPSVTYGTNGFFLKFANSASLGLDSSGNTNNFTANGTGTQTKDTPTNVFATLNPLYPYTSTGAFTNGNTAPSDYAVGQGIVGTLGVSSGKWYYEVKASSTPTENMIGWGATDGTNAASFPGKYANEYARYLGYATYYNNDTATSISGASAYSGGDICGCALDLDGNKIYWYKNGVLENTGGTSITASSTAGNYFPLVRNGNGSNIACNFGNGYFGTTAVSTSNSDSAGLGLFEYSVPSGYYALCTKNIKNYG